MRIALIGGTRFIGHVTAERAIASGHSVFVFHRGVNRCEVDGAREVLVDRSDASTLARALEGAAPDVVVDTRAMTAADASGVAGAVAKLRVPLVVFSSQDVYAQFGRLNGLAAPEPEARVRETSPLTIPYPFRGLHDHEGGPDYDKKEVEKTFRDVCADVTILRIPAVYGRRDFKRRFGFIVDAVDAAEDPEKCTFSCKGGARFRWTHADVEDVAHAAVLAAQARLTGHEVFNVGEERTPTMRERAEAIVAEMGARIVWTEVDAVPDEFSAFGELPNDFDADTSRIRERLGFREVTTAASRLDALVRALRSSSRGVAGVR